MADFNSNSDSTQFITILNSIEFHMVKDLRTNVEKGNTQSVLDGGIDLFIEAALTKKIGLKN